MVFDKAKRLEDITLSDFQGASRISSWIPTHREVDKISKYAKLVNSPYMLDVGCGHGLASFLFAIEDVRVLGVDAGLNKDRALCNSGITNLEFREKNAYEGEIYKGINVIFNSWMPQGEDWSGCFIRKKRFPIIIYVKSRATGMQPGMPMNFNDLNTYRTPIGFVEIDRWSCFGHDDFKSDTSLEIKTQYGEVIVQSTQEFFKKNAKKFQRVKDEQSKAIPYNWEGELPSL
jgi:hypothetical protein